MAVMVLLDFPDEEQARTLIRDMLQYPDSPILTPVQENDVHGEVLAVYKRPTMYHEPFETHGAKKTDAGFTKGQKWGWWVCNACKKPSRLVWESLTKKESMFGKNIMEAFMAPKEESV